MNKRLESLDKDWIVWTLWIVGGTYFVLWFLTMYLLFTEVF